MAAGSSTVDDGRVAADDWVVINFHVRLLPSYRGPLLAGY